jgi:hypothetical protein
MSQELLPLSTEDTTLTEAGESLPFPFQQRTFCRYEPIEKRIEKVRILVVDSLLRDESDLSAVARKEWGASVYSQMMRERQIASMAVVNFLINVNRMV